MASPKIRIKLSNAKIAFSATQTDDRKLLSLIFDNFTASSGSKDHNKDAEMLGTDLTLTFPSECKFKHLVMRLNGMILTTETSSWGLVSARSGRNRILLNGDGESNITGHLEMPIPREQSVRFTFTCLAQRNLAMKKTEAQTTIDTLDFTFDQ
jgi:hypothetical protein